MYVAKRKYLSDFWLKVCVYQEFFVPLHCNSKTIIIMVEEKVSIVKKYVVDFFYRIADSSDAINMADSIIDDVVKDVEETADEEFSDSDIDIAMTRVLKSRL